MPWTCGRCGHTLDDLEPSSVRFCLRCGAAAVSAADEAAQSAQDAAAETLDRRLRWLMVIFGGLWLVLFFVPFGASGYGETIMSWDLLADREGMAHLVAWPLVIGLIFLVLGMVKPLPAWLRHTAAVLLGGVTLGVLAGSHVGGPFADDLSFLFAGGAAWVLMFAAVGIGLLLRARAPQSIGARAVIGLGLLLGLVAYLGDGMGESTLVGALLTQLGQGGVAQAITRVLILLPLFLLLVAFVGFRQADEAGDPVRGWCRVLGVVLIVYLPALMLLYGLMLSVDFETIWYFLMYLKLTVYIAGLLVLLGVGGAWWLDFAARRVLPRLTR